MTFTLLFMTKAFRIEMQNNRVSEYNRDQLATVQAVAKVIGTISPRDVAFLRASIGPYLEFRKTIDGYHARHFKHTCQKTCFDTGLSACCGFESIITFFADHVINALVGGLDLLDRLVPMLERPNRTEKCVYLGESGCLWETSPISCAMFFCDQAKESAFSNCLEAEKTLTTLKEKEKEYTWPIKPVLFDDLEKYFLQFGVESPHLYFHRSPGLLRLKAKAGLNV